MFPHSRPLLRTSYFFPRFNLLHGQSGRHSSNGGRSNLQRSNASQVQQPPSATVATSSTPWWNNPFILPATAATILGGGVLAFFEQQNRAKNESEKPKSNQPLALKSSAQKDIPSTSSRTKEWAQQIADDPSTQLVLTTEALLNEEHPFLEDDHMFSAFVQRGILTSIEGWYDPKAKKFSAIVALGRDTAGFPRVVHGGLTAAIFDEAFGGLLFSLKKSGGLGGILRFPVAYTVQLEVTYKDKIKAGDTVLCTTSIESLQGRKLWMQAEMRDGPEGKVYATARALFVSPRMTKFAKDVIKYLGRKAGEKVGLIKVDKELE